MSQLINASIDVSLLLDMINKAHTAANRSTKNGKVYVNLSIWINDEPDKFGDHASIQLNSAKDGVAKDRLINPAKKDGTPSDKCFIGRGKKADFGNAQLKPGESTGLALNSNIYGNHQQPAPQNSSNPWDQQHQQTPGSGGLPF